MAVKPRGKSLFGTFRPIPPYAIWVRFRGVADIESARGLGRPCRGSICDMGGPGFLQRTLSRSPHFAGRGFLF